MNIAIKTILFLCVGGSLHGAEPLADTPPLGWNSFDSYGVYLHEKAALENIDAFSGKLLPHGYEYFVVDNGWFGEYRLQDDTIFPAEKHAHDVNLTEHGYFLPSKCYFPNGFAPLVKRCQQLGIKFGVHLMRGIPRKAYELNLPIEGTGYTARDIAVTDPKRNCKWCEYCYGVDTSHPGAQAWYDGLIRHIADLGVELIKYDDIVEYPDEVLAVSLAIKRCPKTILLSLSPGNDADPDDIETLRNANMLRVTRDIWDQQEDIDACFAAWRRWRGKERKGFWIDMDMIPFGELQVMSRATAKRREPSKGAVALAGKGTHRWSRLSEAQMRTFITQRALAASPLMIGGNLPSLDGHSLSLLTNADMLACNQNGVMGELVSDLDDVDVWRTMRRGQSDAGWLGVFNRSDSAKTILVTREMLGLKSSGAVDARSVWVERRLEFDEDRGASVEVGPHDVAFLAYQAAPDAPRPNIIYILADDLGYGDLGCYGQARFKTPNIDRLAAGGMRFTQHYAGSTVCAPSRCALMTGLHTGHTPVRGNAEVLPEGQQPMPGGTVTLPKMLGEAGYATGLFGKWGLGAPQSTSDPLKMGFDEFYGYNCQRLAHHYYPYFLWNGDRREMLWGNFGLERREYAPTLIQERVIEFIESNKGGPFFCCYALVQPHAEMIAPETYMQRYRGKFLPESSYEGIDGGPDFRKFPYGSQPEGHAAFAAMVHCIDDYVGEIMAKVRELGIEGNTLIIFTSDNGPHREGGHDPAYFDSNGPLRGFKRDLYEGGIRVPMIAHWQAHVPAGAESDHVSAFWDVMPTAAALAGVTAPASGDGVSFLPTLLGRAGQQQHRFLYWEFHEENGKVAIRMGRWKAVRRDVGMERRSPLELYDLVSDPGEGYDIADQHPKVVAEIESLIAEARTPSSDSRFNFPINPRRPRAARAHEE